MKSTLGVHVAILAVVFLALTGCATKGDVQTDTVVAQEQLEPEETFIQESVPCTSVEHALSRAEELTADTFFGATQYDGSIQFEFDSYVLSAEAKKSIDAVVEPIMETDNRFFLELQGHTDGFGAEAYNFNLGLNRARAVMGYLYSRYGIPLERMNGFSCGELKPIASNSFPQGRAENRRVTVVVIE